MRKHLMFSALPFARMLFAADAGGAPGGGAPPADPPADAAAAAAGAAAAGAGAGAGDPPPAAASAKWWDAYPDAQKTFLTAKGLTLDNQGDVIPRLVDMAGAMEKRIGKGLDNILDRPAKDQALGAWMKANGAALGLPDKEEGYTTAPPEFWPKDAAWDTDLEAKARKFAFENGIPADAHKGYVAIFAEKMKAYHDAASLGAAEAQDKMMADLHRDFGDKTGAKITQAKQAAAFFAEKAGLSLEQIEGVGQVLSDKTGDAGVIRFFAAIHAAMGEDSAHGLGQSSSLTMSPAEARAELAKLRAPGGEYYVATSTNNRTALADLAPKIQMLSKIAG